MGFNKGVILFLLAIGGVMLFANSCKQTKSAFVENKKNDTIQFTYLYSEALKNKMLGLDGIAFNQFIQCLNMNPSSTASAYQLCNLSIVKEDYETAKMYSELCRKDKPNNEWYLVQGGIIAKKLNELTTYAAIYKKLSNLFPANLNYVYEFAVIEYKNKNYDGALESLKKLEEEVGINESISFLRNNINYEIKRFDAIQLELLKLKSFFPDSVKYSDMLAEFYLTFNQPENAIRLYNNVLRADRNNFNANLGLSWIYAKTKQFEIGLPYLLVSLESKQLDTKRKLEVVRMYTNTKEKRLHEDKVKLIYEKAIGNRTTDSELLNEYIAYLFLQKNLTLAEKYAKYSINQFPENFTGWDYFFKILFAQGRHVDLNVYSGKCLEYFSNHADVYFYCGYSNFVLKNYSEAINYFEMGIDYVVDDEVLLSQFYLTMAESYHASGKHNKSDYNFDKYIELDSSNAYLMNNYAYYLAQRNSNLEKALKLSRKSIELEPFNSSFLDTYSKVLFSMKDYEKALNYAQRAYKYGGNKNPVVVEHYGDILEKLGRTEEALERWKEAFTLNKSNDKLKLKIEENKL